MFFKLHAFLYRVERWVDVVMSLSLTSWWLNRRAEGVAARTADLLETDLPGSWVGFNPDPTTDVEPVEFKRLTDPYMTSEELEAEHKLESSRK